MTVDRENHRPADPAREAREDAHGILAVVADRMDEFTYDEVSTLVEGLLDGLQVADEERAADRAEVERLRADKAEFERWRDQWIVDMESTVASCARAEDEAMAAEARLDALVAELRGLMDEWVNGPGLALEWNVPIGETFGKSVRAVLDKHAGEQAQGGDRS